MIGFVAATLLAAVQLPAIHTDGLNLKDSSGHTVQLKGVNLGGWLVEEPWMTPIVSEPPAGSSEPKVTDHRAIWGLVEKRLGHDSMVRVRDAWRDNWITKTDFDRIKAAGFNHVRIPFLVSLLDEPNGLARLHWAVDTAAADGLYTVLDMHGAPGGQSDEAHNGLGKSNRLWFDVDNIIKMENAWIRLAKEFKTSNAAMFDLMNEPMGAPNPAMLMLVYDRVIRAIRTVDPNKVLLVEDGYKGFDTTVHPNLANWTNVCYSLHFYNFDAKKTEDHITALDKDVPKLKDLQGYRQTPLYIGEFNLEPFAGPEVTHQFVGRLNAAGWSWAIWTWKACPVSGTLGQWGIERRPSLAPALNPYTDSADEMIQKAKAFRTENFEPIPGLLDALTG